MEATQRGVIVEVRFSSAQQQERNDDVVNLLPGEQGDPLVASLANGVSIYANWPLPTYCMFTVRESDIVVSTVVITGE